MPLASSGEREILGAGTSRDCAADDALQEILELGRAGKGELEAHLDVLELGPGGHRGPDQHERARRAGELLRRLPQQPQRGRRLEVRRRDP